MEETVSGIERGCGGVAGGQVANLSYAVVMTGLGKAVVVDQTLCPEDHNVERVIGPSHDLQAVVAVKKKPGPVGTLWPKGRRMGRAIGSGRGAIERNRRQRMDQRPGRALLCELGIL